MTSVNVYAIIMNMKGVEFAPFYGDYRGFGTVTFDSIVGKLTNTRSGKDFVVKWNRRYISSEQEAFEICKFVKKSYELYTQALGKEFVTETTVILGEKKDSGLMKFKSYIAQPFVDSWTGRTLPEELRNITRVIDQWTTLNERLFHLYNTAYKVNRQHEPQMAFPITLTLGESRRRALNGMPGGPVPKTPNLLIRKSDLQLQICDLGEYIAWKPQMEHAYNEILSGVLKR